MNRPWQTGLALSLCLCVLFAALGWASVKVLELEQVQAESARQAQLEENVRLALWRMDSLIVPLIAQENARPYFVYTAFYPAQRAYNSMFAPVRPGEVLIPSRLLAQPSAEILLHFQCGPDKQLTSPQSPTGNMCDLAESTYVASAALSCNRSRLDELTKKVDWTSLVKSLPANSEPNLIITDSAPAPIVAPNDDSFQQAEGPNQQPAQQQLAQVARGAKEFQKRKLNYESNSANTLISKNNDSQWSGLGSVREGWLVPVWSNGALLLARRVLVHNESYVQGCWLDWPAIQTRLLHEIEDLLPDAKIEPVIDGDSTGEATRLLASLPVRLLPGALAAEPDPGMSPLRLSLAVAWGCVALSVIAVGMLFVGAVSLSERRGAFVSAVTHELRTPLTTFRMYAEMLADGMVNDPEKRQGYLNTLKAEADRLGHLVENVLSYARLERGRAGGGVESVIVADLLDGMESRLAQRARQAEMQFVLENGDAIATTRLRVDRLAVEQILFNLVDNACKYAAGADDRRLLLNVARDGAAVAFSLRDHGAGIAGKESRRLFRPFTKSAQAAANSAPGIGLGLALSRRLARQMGGDLRLDRNHSPGATFVLTLPIAP